MRRFILLIVCVIAVFSTNAQDRRDQFEITDSMRQDLLDFLNDGTNLTLDIYQNDKSKLDTLIVRKRRIQEGPIKSHLKFMGVEMSGSIENFVQTLIQKKKLKLLYHDKNSKTRLLKGSFSGFECMIAVYPNKNNTVGRVTVALPSADNWSDLESEYSLIQTGLIRKYGNPMTEYKHFKQVDPSDTGKFMELMNNECNYGSTFLLSEGSILLSMQKDEANFLSAFVILMYVDISSLREAKNAITDDL